MHEKLPLSPDPLELQLHSGVAVLQTLTQAVTQTGRGDRVALTTMSFEPNEPLVDGLLSALHGAADRGAHIHLGIDAFTFLVDNTSGSIGPLLAPLPIGQEAFRRRQAAIESLQARGDNVTVNRLNDPTRLLKNPFAGRSHIKAAVVGDHCFVIGPNLHQTERADMGVSFEHRAIADRLHGTLAALVEHGDTAQTFGSRDHIWQLDPNTQLLIDSGVPGQSSIMQAALDMIEAANDEAVLISLQYAPRGKVAHSLAQAALQRNVSLRALYNHPATQGLVGGLAERLALARARWRRLPAAVFAHQLPHPARQNAVHNHAKALATGSAALIGSNNFDPRGVDFGTAEMSLARYNDPVFAERVGQFVCELLGASQQQPYAAAA